MQKFTIGNITFDDLLCVSLKKEVFMKLPLIKKYVYNEEYFDMQLKSLKFVHDQPTERILDSISATNNEIVKHFGNKITQEKETLYYSSVLWEWFYLLAYYIHQLDNDPLWQENFLPHAKAFQIRPIAIKETEDGEKLINQFIDKRKRVLETQKQLQQPDTLHINTPDNTQQHEAKVPAFRIAGNRKTDTMKIFNYMYDLGLFVDKSGKELKRQKKQFMTAIGKFFDEDFEKYAQTINSAAQEEHFMDIFHDLLDKAQKKYLAE